MVRRFSDNPLITPDDVRSFDDRFEVVGVFNPGVTTYEGKTLLLMRVAVRPEENGIIRVPVFKDGKVTVMELEKRFDENEDTRVVMANGKKYLTSMSYFVPAVSADGENFEIMYDGAIYPESRFEEYGVEDPRITKLGKKYYITKTSASFCTRTTRTWRCFPKRSAESIICCIARPLRNSEAQNCGLRNRTIWCSGATTDGLWA